MSTRFGACVARARLQARFGSPIPTNTTSRSRSSFAARTAMSSEFVYVSASEAVVDSFAKTRFRSQALAQSRHLVHVRSAIGDAVDEFLEPRLQSRIVARHFIPRDVEVVVAIIVALRVRRMRAPRFADDGVDDEAWDERPVRIGAHDRWFDDLLDYHDDALCGERRFFLDAVEPPDLRVAFGIGALRVDDRHVGIERRYGRKLFICIRAADGPDERISGRQVTAAVIRQRPERELRGAGAETRHHAEVRVLLDVERHRRTFLDRAAQRVERADAGISRPRKDELARASRGDELIVDEIGGQSADRQVFAALADDLMRRREADEMREAFDDDDVAVAHEPRDGVLHRNDLRGDGLQAGTRSSASTSSSMRSAIAASSSSTTSGGARRIVLWPQLRSSKPLRKAASSISCTMWCSGFFVCRSATNSMPIMSPRPRTSPMMSCFFASERKPSSKTLPTRVAFCMSPFSMRSSVASAAAQATGLPPNVLPWLPWPHDMTDSFAMIAPIGSPEPSPFASR